MNKRLQRVKRHRRVRAKVFGTAARPRFSVFRSNKYLHAQMIDDETGKTLAHATTKAFDKLKGDEQISAVAKKIAEKAAAAGIKQAVFDRGGFKYHGKIAKLAESLRSAGLKI